MILKYVAEVSAPSNFINTPITSTQLFLATVPRIRFRSRSNNERYKGLTLRMTQILPPPAYREVIGTGEPNLILCNYSTVISPRLSSILRTHAWCIRIPRTSKFHGYPCATRTSAVHHRGPPRRVRRLTPRPTISAGTADAGIISSRIIYRKRNSQLCLRVLSKRYNNSQQRHFISTRKEFSVICIF